MKGWHFLEQQLVPAPILERARSIEAKVERAIAANRERRDALLPLFDRAVAVQARIDDLRTLITTQWNSVRAQRLQLQELPLWKLGSAHAQVGLIAAELRSAWSVLDDYLTLESPGLAGAFLAILALCVWLFTRRSEQAPGSAPRAYGRPVAASLLIALMSLVVAGTRPALPVIRGASAAGSASRRDGDAQCASSFHSAYALRTCRGHDAAGLAPAWSMRAR
jgi:hypothetical protein